METGGIVDVKEWFAELDRLGSEPFMPEGRSQPDPPVRDVFEWRPLDPAAGLNRARRRWRQERGGAMFEADEARWPLVVVRSTESGSPAENADAYVALWERWLARGDRFGVLVAAGDTRGEPPPPAVAERMRAWQEAARERIRGRCVGIAYVMPAAALATHRPMVKRRSEMSLGCPGDAFGSEDEAAEWLAERVSAAEA